MHALAGAAVVFRRTLRRVPTLGVLLCCWLAATPLRAQPAGDVEQRASAHFDRGVALYEDGSLDAALVEFERAYALVPSYRLLYNLGQIQAERHDYAAALGHFERYLQEGGEELPEARRTEVREQLEKLRERVGELWVTTDVAQATLFVDDELSATLPLERALPINAGVSRLRLESPGHRSVTRVLKVAGGDQLRLSLPLGEPIEASKDGPEAGNTRAVSNYRPAWIVAASALALGAGTLTFGLLAGKADRSVERELDRIPVRSEQLDEQRGRLKTFAGLTDGFAVATAIAVGVAAYLAIDPPKTKARARDLTLRRSLRVLASERGFALHGVF